MEQLKGKVALVTGGNKGIGKAIALALAAEGVQVAITGRNEQDLQAVKQLIEKAGVKAAYAVADINKIDQVNEAVAVAVKELGAIDILVNNAGIAAFGTLTEMSVQEWEAMIQTNVLGVYYACRAVVPSMIERNTGDIINIASTAGLRGNAGTSAYSASKFAVLGLTESLTMEVRKHNIRVTALTPSTVATDMALQLKLTDGNPEKVMQPEDVAELVVAQLKLNRRTFIKSSSIWSTNP